MKKLSSLVFVLFLLSINSFAQNKWSLGIGLQASQSKLHNISQNQYFYEDPLYGNIQYTAPSVGQHDILSYGGHIIVERRIGRKSSIDFGIGIQTTRNTLFLDYTPDTSGIPSNNNMLNIQRLNAYLPVHYNHFFRLGSNVKLKTALGFIANYKINANDNYNDINPAEIYINPNDMYYKLNVLGRAKVGIRYEVDSYPCFEFNLFYNYGKFNGLRQSGQNSGFIYENLYNANERQLGLEVNYFFLH